MVVSEEDIPLLKSWVHNRIVQTPDVEADDILTEYVITLLQHDEPIDKLKESCLSELKDFLHNNTESFVNDLMAVYQSKAYRNPSQQLQQIQAQGEQQQQQPQPQQQIQQPLQPQAQNQIPGLNSLNGGVPNFNGQQPSLVFNPFNGSNNMNPFGFPPPQFDQSNNNNNNNNNDQYDPSNSDLFQTQGNNNFHGHNGYNNDGRRHRNHRNRGGYNNNNNRQNWNENRFNNNNNHSNTDTNSIEVTGGFNNNANNNGSYQNGFHKKNNRGYLQSIASTAPDDEFIKKKLVIEKIPDDKFNEHDVRAYFSQFGSITHLTLDTANHLVLLEYATHHEARQAWSSPEAIFGNRFVKVYWRKADENDATENAEPEKIDVEAVRQVQAQKQKEFEEKMAKKRANQEKMLQILEQKQRLIEMQKQHQNKLLEIALKKGDTNEIHLKKTTAAALQLQLDNLKREASLLSSGASTSHRGGYRGGRGAGRGGAFASSYSPYSRPTATNPATSANTARFNLDLRPRTVAVSPIPGDKEEAFRSYLLSIGEYESIVRVDENTLYVTFKDRRTAEVLFYGPATVSDVGEIQKTWKPTQSSKPASLDGTISTPAATADTVMDIN